jgi:hypothetical protein
MFEVFAVVCALSGYGLNQCDDYVIDSYDDRLTCEISAAGSARDKRYYLVACIPSPEIEPMP